ncbi:hypothetical protein VNO78_31700 [Psophocarpus tetragonolobus]|uniref:EF-hand domain-containing protein n=1 Tax=Psophocarpus tetragonolobus TaxID=3891 RepID=A0AAN9X7I2_PSOTE
MLIIVGDEQGLNVCVRDLFAQLDTDTNGLLSYEEKQRLRVLENGDPIWHGDELTCVYESLYVQLDHDLKEFKEEMKQIMLAMADGLGSLAVQMALQHDSLLMKAVHREYYA